MNERFTAIYARQSVDKKDSISIETQIELCKREFQGGVCKEYFDKGYSGKNTERPMFQQMISDIRQGKISKVIVYKLDRISRSVLDFANIWGLFSEYKVEFVSCNERFDTSTPMGRAMLNIAMVFAQLERETIQNRILDAFVSRSEKGLYTGGRLPFGFRSEAFTMHGVNTKKLVPIPEEAEQVKLMFEMYAEPNTSYGDIARYFVENGLRTFRRTAIAKILCNPIYVKADLDVYEFFKSQGTIIINEPEDFAGTNGCYFHRNQDIPGSTCHNLQGHKLVLAPSEGFISSDIWLRCRKKILANKTYQSGRKPTKTWLSGKIKCGRCGKALRARPTPTSGFYFRCLNLEENHSCQGAGTLRVPDVESAVYALMVNKLEPFKTLKGRKEIYKPSPELTAAKIELAKVEKEIENFLDVLGSGAGDVLTARINERMENLDARRTQLVQRISQLSIDEISPDTVNTISGFLDCWDDVSFDDKRQVTDALISSIAATSEGLKIVWKI